MKNVLKELETTGRYIVKWEYIRMDLKEQAGQSAEAYDWLKKQGPDRENKTGRRGVSGKGAILTNEGNNDEQENTVLELSPNPAIITSVNNAK